MNYDSISGFLQKKPAAEKMLLALLAQQKSKSELVKEYYGIRQRGDELSKIINRRNGVFDRDVLSDLEKFHIITKRRGKIIPSGRKKILKENKRFQMVDIDFDTLFEYWKADCKRKIPFGKDVSPDKGWMVIFGENSDNYLLEPWVVLNEFRGILFNPKLYAPLFRTGVKISIAGFINTAMAFSFIAYVRVAEDKIPKSKREEWKKYAENMLMLLNSLYVGQTEKDYPEIITLTNTIVDELALAKDKLRLFDFTKFFSLLTALTTAKSTRFLSEEYCDARRPLESISSPLLGYEIFIDWVDAEKGKEKWQKHPDISGQLVKVKKPFAIFPVPLVEVTYAEAALNKARRFFR